MRWIAILSFVFIFSYADSDDYKERLHIPKDLSFLHLNSSQKQKLKIALQNYRKKLKELHEKEEKLEKELQKMFVKKRFDKERFLKKSILLRKEIAKVEADFFATMHKILNKKQRQMFVEYIEEWEIE